MISFTEYLTESRNTLIADVNEILVGYYLNSGRWYDPEARQQHDQRKGQITPQDYQRADEHAKVMAKEFISWAHQHGYHGNPTHVYWTARPGSMAKLVGVPVDQKKNPTDTLIKFASGPANGWLGLSAKSTKGKGEIGFKNPGVGTIDRSLGLSIATNYKTQLDQIIAQHDLPKSATTRKQFLRSNPKIKAKTEKMGQEMLASMRDILYNKLKSMHDEQLLKHCTDEWMNADVMYPPYIKVTGKGNKPPYTATVVDPVKNEKLEALGELNFEIEKVGNESIGIKAGGKKIMKMRFKFESEKLASSVKLSGESW